MSKDKFDSVELNRTESLWQHHFQFNIPQEPVFDLLRAEMFGTKLRGRLECLVRHADIAYGIAQTYARATRS